MNQNHTRPTSGFLLLKLVALEVLFAAYLIASPNVPASDHTTKSESDKKQRIIEQLRRSELRPYPATEKKVECEMFFQDFQKQRNIDYLQPAVTANKVDDSNIQTRIKHCPSFELSRNCFWRWAHGESIVPRPDKSERCGEEVNGTKNFQIYNLDFDNNPNNGTETIYYEEGLKGDRVYFGGIYKLLDLRNCSVVSYVHVPPVGSYEATTFHEHGFIRYNNRIYVLDFSINQSRNSGLSWAHLTLYRFYLSERHGVLFLPTCKWGPPIRKSQ
jgi:hypothetical protein